MNRGYRGYDALGFTLPITSTNGNTLEGSFFWVEMKGLKSFGIPLERRKHTVKGRKDPKAKQPRNTPSRDIAMKGIR